MIYTWREFFVIFHRKIPTNFTMFDDKLEQFDEYRWR